MVKFHETRLGRDYYQRDFPALVTELREMNASLQQSTKLQNDLLDIGMRVLVKSMPKDQLPNKVIKFEWRFGSADINTSYFNTVEEFMKYMMDRSGEDFESELQFSKWMLETDLRYETTVYYAP